MTAVTSFNSVHFFVMSGPNPNPTPRFEGPRPGHSRTERQLCAFDGYERVINARTYRDHLEGHTTASRTSDLLDQVLRSLLKASDISDVIT